LDTFKIIPFQEEEEEEEACKKKKGGKKLKKQEEFTCYSEKAGHCLVSATETNKINQDT